VVHSSSRECLLPTASGCGRNKLSFTEDLAVTFSQGETDPDWDEFVRGVPGGQHEQTCLWAQVKAVDGWKAVRTVFRQDGRIVAGYQMLWRPMSPFGHVAYVTQGPLLSDDCTGLATQLSLSLCKAAREYGISALIVNPPRDGNYTTENLDAAGFRPNHLVRVIDTTYELDLRKSSDELLQGMRESRRKNIRRGLRSGRLAFHEGHEAELRIFHDLMCATCRRQSVIPNPDWRSLSAMWQLYRPKSCLHLFFIALDGEHVSGGLVITFGERASFWKMGWSGNHAKLRPNDILHWEIICWAKRQGYRFLDLMGIASKALEIDAGLTVPSKEFMKSPSFYKMGFGGRIVKLPKSCVYVDNPVLRIVYALAFSRFCRQAMLTTLSVIPKLHRRCKR